MVFTRKDGIFHGRAVSFREGRYLKSEESENIDSSFLDVRLMFQAEKDVALLWHFGETRKFPVFFVFFSRQVG